MQCAIFQDLDVNKLTTAINSFLSKNVSYGANVAAGLPDVRFVTQSEVLESSGVRHVTIAVFWK